MHVLQLGSSVRNIVNMAMIAVVDAQIKNKLDTHVEVHKTSWWKRLKKKK